MLKLLPHYTILKIIIDQAKGIYAAWLLIFLWLAIQIILILFYGYRDLHDARIYLGEADYILTNGHLPNLPSARKIKKDGINTGEMSVQLLRKVEELTVYVIKLSDRLNHLEKK